MGERGRGRMGTNKEANRSESFYIRNSGLLLFWVLGMEWGGGAHIPVGIL